jgi:hypothetical protein
MTNCEKWLSEYLTKNEAVLVQTVTEKAKQAGYKKAELKNARKSLGVKTFHLFDDDGTDSGSHFWHLP